MKTPFLMIALLASTSAQAAPAKHKALGNGSKAVTCTGKTMRLSREGQTYEDFRATFLLNDTEKTWLLYLPGTDGTEPKCSRPDCVLNYGSQQILAKSVDGITVNLLDRTAGNFEELIRYGAGAVNGHRTFPGCGRPKFPMLVLRAEW